MSRPTRFVSALVVYLGVAACRDTTSPADRVVLTVARAAAADSGQFVTYTYRINNQSAVSLWLPGCGGGRPEFDIQVAGATVNSLGNICLARVYYAPVEIAPGASLRGTGFVLARGGAIYVPRVAISRTPNGSAAIVRGHGFSTP